jgi:hypothetical protein
VSLGSCWSTGCVRTATSGNPAAGHGFHISRTDAIASEFAFYTCRIGPPEVA